MLVGEYIFWRSRRGFESHRVTSVARSLAAERANLSDNIRCRDRGVAQTEERLFWEQEVRGFDSHYPDHVGRSQMDRHVIVAHVLAGSIPVDQPNVPAARNGGAAFS